MTHDSINNINNNQQIALSKTEAVLQKITSGTASTK